jgi:hypothetical protein
MKKIMNKINFAIIALMTSVPAFAADPANRYDIKVEADMCDLVKRLHGVFDVLRIMAFIGAAFYIAGWAWDFIKGGEAKMDDVKKRGLGLLVGFSLLFIIGLVLTFIMSAAGMELLGCDQLKKW